MLSRLLCRVFGHRWPPGVLNCTRCGEPRYKVPPIDWEEATRRGVVAPERFDLEVQFEPEDEPEVVLRAEARIKIPGGVDREQLEATLLEEFEAEFAARMHAEGVRLGRLMGGE